MCLYHVFLRRKGLQSIVHAMSNKKQEMNRIVAIVKKDSKFKILKDLKGAKACFTGYKSVGTTILNKIASMPLIFSIRSDTTLKLLRECSA